MDKAFDAVLQSEVEAAVIAKTLYCFFGGAISLPMPVLW